MAKAVAGCLKGIHRLSETPIVEERREVYLSLGRRLPVLLVQFWGVPCLETNCCPLILLKGAGVCLELRQTQPPAGENPCEKPTQPIEGCIIKRHPWGGFTITQKDNTILILEDPLGPPVERLE